MKPFNCQKWGGLLLALTVLMGGPRAEAETFSEASLQKACVTLQHTPLSMPDLQILADVSRSTTNHPALRRHAMAAYALSLLMQGNTNAFNRAVQIQKTAFPDQTPLITIGKADYTATCTDCLGKAEKSTTCPLCMGSGTCKTCNGTGKKTASAGKNTRCPSCARPGTCNRCNGKKNIEIVCPTCHGSGQIFKLSESVRKNFRALLSGIEVICQERADYTERLKKAQLETDADTRIRLLQSLTNSFSHRPDLAQAHVLLGDAVAKRETRLKTIQEREARARSEREVAELHKRVATESPESAIAALRTYLAEHPNTPALIELQALLDGLTYKQERKQLTRKILLVLGTLVGILLLFLFVHPLLLRKRVQGIQPLPGMRNIDRNKFTDPLSLTARDSRNRVKNRTSRIPFHDKT